MQTWTKVIETSNSWSSVDNKLYVVADYWVDGYVEDNQNQWTVISQTNNSWTNINT